MLCYDLAMRNTAVVTSGNPIAVGLISDVSAVNPLVAFYDIHQRRGAILLFSHGHHTRHNYGIETQYP
jgi:hypothetical protein